MKKILTWMCAIAVCNAVYAKELKQAEVTAVVNEVSILNQKISKPAKVKDVVSGKALVNTGAKSRAELLFNDKTLARIGANATFSFEEGTRNMDLKKGTMLLQVPKGAGGASIRTAAVTAAITGTTVMVSSQPGQNTKVIVLEGTLKLYLNGRSGEFIIIHAGQMISMDPNAKTLPTPVNIDLKKLAGTSALVNGIDTSNLDMTLIDQQIAQQQEDIKNAKLVILDKDQNTVMDAAELMSTVDQAVKTNPNTNPNQSTRGGQSGGGGGQYMTKGY